MSYKYFENKDCEFYPCHSLSSINCLFCFCPLYSINDCGGSFKLISKKDGKTIKDCSDCTIVHKKENYEYVLKKLSEI